MRQLVVFLMLGVCSVAAEEAEFALSGRLAAWKRSIEARGGPVFIVRVDTDARNNEIRISTATPRRTVLAGYLSNEQFVSRFLATHAMTVNHQSREGRLHFVLLNMTRYEEWKEAEEALVAHELGHAWLDAEGFRSLPLRDTEDACLAIHASDIVQHVLIRRELDRRKIDLRPYWIRNLNQALEALRSGPQPGGVCETLARISLWTDVTLGIGSGEWPHREEFDRAFRRAYPGLAPTVDELAAVLGAVDVREIGQYTRALAYVRRRLAITAGMEKAGEEQSPPTSP